jgi:hypothetical protein
MHTFSCPICQSKRESVFTETVLQKYRVNYLYCTHCGLLQTEEPHWLEEAYSRAIAAADTGLIQRNLRNSKVLACLLYFLFAKEAKYLDVAGGYGMLTRLMRDIGFDFYWTDKYCENLLAHGFELDNTTPSFTAITAFEVLEHVYEPLAFFQNPFSSFQINTAIFSTELFAGDPPKPSEWWYYGFNCGQHISFYQEKTLQFMARQLDLNFYTHGNIHMFTDAAIKTSAFNLLTNNYTLPLFYKYVSTKMASKTISDYMLLSNTGD